jgi:prepilin-type N-terminal cleavage/methylation domain-containing protein
MKRLGRKGVSLPELLTVIAVMGILALIADWSMKDYLLTVRLQCATDMIMTDIRQARYNVYTWGDPYHIDFEPSAGTYRINGKSTMRLPNGISFGAAPGVTGRPSDPYNPPPRDGITFRGEGTENRAEFLPKGLVVPTGAVYLTNGRETMAITVTLNGHTTAWKSKGGNKWVEI